MEGFRLVSPTIMLKLLDGSHLRCSRVVVGCLAAMLFCPLYSFGSAVAVDFGGDMVSRSRDLRLGQEYENPEGTFSRIRIGSMPLSPEPRLYDGPTFYGIIQQQGDPSAFTWNARVVDGLDGDYLQVRAFYPEEITLNTILFFKKEDFSGGVAAAPNLSLSALDSLSANISALAGSSNESSEAVRFVVLNGNQWYISESSASGSGPFVLGNGAASRWARWSLPPQTGGKVNPVPTSFDVAGSSLNDIQAVGLWTQVFGTATGNAVAEFRLPEFKTVWIPESGSVALGVALFAGALAVVRLRRNRPR